MVNVMITGQHSLVTQMNTSNLITMQTQFFGTIKNTPLRELLNFFFTLISHFVFLHVKLEDTKPLSLERI